MEKGHRNLKSRKVSKLYCAEVSCEEVLYKMIKLFIKTEAATKE